MGFNRVFQAGKKILEIGNHVIEGRLLKVSIGQEVTVLTKEAV